jgi:hypothetical protein
MKFYSKMIANEQVNHLFCCCIILRMTYLRFRSVGLFKRFYFFFYQKTIKTADIIAKNNFFKFDSKNLLFKNLISSKINAIPVFASLKKKSIIYKRRATRFKMEFTSMG